MTCGSMRNLSDALGYSNVQIFLDHVQKNLDITRFRDLPSGIPGKRTLARLAVRHLREADASATCRPASQESGRFRDLPSGISGKRTLPRLAVRHLREADASAT